MQALWVKSRYPQFGERLVLQVAFVGLRENHSRTCRVIRVRTTLLMQ